MIFSRVLFRRHVVLTRGIFYPRVFVVRLPSYEMVDRPQCKRLLVDALRSFRDRFFFSFYIMRFHSQGNFGAILGM